MVSGLHQFGLSVTPGGRKLRESQHTPVMLIRYWTELDITHGVRCTWDVILAILIDVHDNTTELPEEVTLKWLGEVVGNHLLRATVLNAYLS